MAYRYREHCFAEYHICLFVPAIPTEIEILPNIYIYNAVHFCSTRFLDAFTVSKMVFVSYTAQLF